MQTKLQFSALRTCLLRQIKIIFLMLQWRTHNTWTSTYIVWTVLSAGQCIRSCSMNFIHNCGGSVSTKCRDQSSDRVGTWYDWNPCRLEHEWIPEACHLCFKSFLHTVISNTVPPQLYFSGSGRMHAKKKLHYIEGKTMACILVLYKVQTFPTEMTKWAHNSWFSQGRSLTSG